MSDKFKWELRSITDSHHLMRPIFYYKSDDNNIPFLTICLLADSQEWESNRTWCCYLLRKRPVRERDRSGESPGAGSKSDTPP